MHLSGRWPLFGIAIIACISLSLVVSADDKPIDANWWSLRPLRKPTTHQSIDGFIQARYQQLGLQASIEADRRTLIRRLTFNLHGLPPTMDEVRVFVNDTRSDAYEKLVDRLLASPRYGERWARHWLDVVHYADSHGQDQDRPRPNAWPYRDYLIRALNSDTPYAQFVQEQIAGDVLFPQNPGIIPATGFLAAGPWDESGLMGIREDSLDRQIAHYLDRDDIVTNTMSTFAGATIHCARCHDHKFDPFTQADYYALQAVFAGIDKAERTYDADPVVNQKRQKLTTEIEKIRHLNDDAITPEMHKLAEQYEANWHRYEFLWLHPYLLETQTHEGTILKPLMDHSLLAVGKRPEKDTYKLSYGSDLARVAALRLEVLTDETLPHQGPGRSENGNLHLSEVRITVAPRTRPQAKQVVQFRHATADFNQEGWSINSAIDGKPVTAWGIYPQVGKPHQAIFSFAQPFETDEGILLTVELDQHHGGGHLLGRFRITISDDTNAKLPVPAPDAFARLLRTNARWRTVAQRAEMARVTSILLKEQELALLPSPKRVYCGTNRFPADGSFKPAVSPRMVHVLKRGEISKPGPVALPGSIAVVPVQFRVVSASDPEGVRRAALAQWLTHPDNPLTWRTIVNRVWHYHFGRGLVDTPNDLGRMGGEPSHPELLDWLAVEFRDNGGSLKKLHKLILTSKTYRQSTRHHAEFARKDGDNRYLWRMNRGRLDAESLRDAVLSLTGKLDGTMYGPPVKHFEMKPGIHVTPLADYDKFDVDSVDSRRRSIYRYLFRTRPDPLLAALDCPDASQSAPVRGTSVGALQALALWNNKFMLRYAEHLAEMSKQHSTDLNMQLQAITERLFQRSPTDSERKDWTSYVQDHGLASLCRVLLNSSEFLFVE